MPLSLFGASWVGGLITTTDTYLALLTSYPTPINDGSELLEPAGASYARVLLDHALWGTAEAGVYTYDDEITYDPAESWGTINSYALCSTMGKASGSVYAYEYTQYPINFRAGVSVVIATGMLSIEVQ